MSLLKILISITGIYTCFLTWGVLQERVSTTPYGNSSKNPQRFRYFIFLNMIQSFMAAIVAFFYLRLTGKKLGEAAKNPWLIFRYFQMAALQSVGSLFGYESLKYVDYPTMILGKSCKLPAVMLMGVVIYGKRFPLYNYVVMLLITLGVSGFMLLQPVSEKKKAAASNSIYGIVLIAINLSIDGITNSTQDQVFNRYKVPGQKMMFFLNLFSGLLMLGWLCTPWSHELGNAIAFCSLYPGVVKHILLFSLCGALGQCFIFYTLENFNSLYLITITITRKLFTMLLSAFWFDHRLSVGQWVAVAMVFSGIGLEVFVKQQEKSRLVRSFNEKEKASSSHALKKNGYKIQ